MKDYDKIEYGYRYSDKCTPEELKEFKEIIRDFLNENNYKNLKLKSFNCFGGEVRIYTGQKINRMPQRMRRRLVAFKEPDGKWKGDLETLKNEGVELRGTEIWQTHNEPIEEIECFPTNRIDWNNNNKQEKEMIFSFLKNAFRK